MSQFEGMMGGSPGEGFGGPPENVHLGPDQRYGYNYGQPSNVYQGTANQPSSSLYHGTGGGPPPSLGNVYQGNVPPPVATGPSPYNLQSVTAGMGSMLPPSSGSSAPSIPHVGSITQYATPPPQQQQQPSPATNSYVSQPTTTDSYAARSAMAHASTGGSLAGPTTTFTQVPPPSSSKQHSEPSHDQAHQNRILTDATRKVQEHAYYMKQAMDRDDLPVVLDRASHMVGELGDRHTLSPKNYYELHMRALDDMPNLEEYFLGIQPVRFVYDASQYCPKVLPRLYLQICASSALIRSEEEKNVTVILNDLTQAVKCVQNPVRGLFLRHYLLQALRDKLPDGKDPEKGTVENAYNFVMSNFIEMNNLWVRLQHLPGDGKSKEQRKKRERERNELRILVGTNLVRLSQMEGVTSQIYGQVILPKILEQIVACGDPLAQAYLIDCIIQVFPDEYHIETLSILLAVCPKLRDKVNIRTILQSLMDRLANYYAEEELLDETDTNQVKKSLAMDSFTMFEECVQNVYNARGPKLTTKEVIRLQTALLNFSLKCYPGHMAQVNRCLGVCVTALRQAANAIPSEGTIIDVPSTPKLDEASITDLEKLLSIPLDTLALKVLQLDHYGDLLACLPWENRRDVGMTMLQAIVSSGGSPPKNVKELEELFTIIAPVFREEHAVPPKEHTAREVDLLKGLGVISATESFGPIAEDAPVGPERTREILEECNLVSKMVHMLDHEDTDVAFEMLSIARNHLSMGGKSRVGYTLVPVVFLALRLVDRIYVEEYAPPKQQGQEKTEDTVTSQPAVGESKGETQKDKTKEEGEHPGMKDEGHSKSAHDDGEAQEETDSAAEKKVTTEAPQAETVTDDRGQAEADVDLDRKECAAVDTPASDEKQHEPQKENGADLSWKKTVSCRKVFVFLQKTVAMLANSNVELAIKLYLQITLAADNIAALGHKDEFGPIVYELLSQAFVLYEEEIGDSKAQTRNIKVMIGTLLACQTMSNEEYESLIPKAAQYSAKLLKKPDQCQMVALCAHLFYVTRDRDGPQYKNPQRALECLQRALKLADVSTRASAAYVYLFVDLLDHYVYFFEKENPSITDKYVSGLAALIKEHLMTLTPAGSGDAAAINDSKSQFDQILRYIQSQKESPDTQTAERFSLIQCDPKFP